MFSDGFSTTKHQAHARLSAIFNYEVYNCINKKIYRTKADLLLSKSWQNMKKKIRYFPLFAKLRGKAHIGDVIDKRMINNDD